MMKELGLDRMASKDLRDIEAVYSQELPSGTGVLEAGCG
jgi:hypothetical protein